MVAEAPGYKGRKLMDAIAERNEALRKIGRNVVLFQELERTLKWLHQMQRLSAPVSRLERIMEARARAVRKHTLGRLGTSVLDAFHADDEPELRAPREITEPWLTFDFCIADAAEAKASLSSLTQERNELIHHLLDHYDLRDAKSCRKLSVDLDAQRERVVLEIKQYSAFRTAFIEAGRAHIEQMIADISSVTNDDLTNK